VREQDAKTGANQVEALLVPVPTDEESPERRLMRTHETLRWAKERQRAVPAGAMQGAGELVMPALFIRASRAASLVGSLGGASANLVISNVPGPSKAVYLAGARVEALYPVGGLMEGMGINTVVFSYGEWLDLGVLVDRDSPVDPWRLADAFERSQRELVALTPRPTARSARQAAQR
jgi:diacylglycerol O-acyltransferase